MDKYEKKTVKKRIRVECESIVDKSQLRLQSGSPGNSQRLRCKSCKKRFMTSWINCNPAYEQCWHETFPPHRKLILK